MDLLYTLVENVFDDNTIKEILTETVNAIDSEIKEDRIAFINADTKVYARVKAGVVEKVVQRVNTVGNDLSELDGITEDGVNQIIEAYLTEIDSYIEKRQDIEENLRELKELLDDKDITAEETHMITALLRTITTGILLLDGDPKQSKYAGIAKKYADEFAKR